MTQRSPVFDRVAQQLIEHAVANLSETDEVGPALNEALMRLARALATMVGEVGFQALFLRAVHLTRKDEPALPLSVAPAAEAARVAWMDCVACLGSEAAVRCAALLSANVLVLLASFIGEDLTFRLIRRALHDFKDVGSSGGQEP